MSLSALNRAPAEKRLPWASSLAYEALLAEAELTPKPALVDRRGSGAHRDLSLELMRCSAEVIAPYFAAMEETAWGRLPDQRLREELASIGRHAERAMLQATGGSNTHKGAIWALGLLVAASSGTDSRNALDVTEYAARLARWEDRAAPVAVSHGDQVARKYGVAGAREEARRGFPQAIHAGLPALRASRSRGMSETVARLDALAAIMAALDDTCLLYRGGSAALQVAKRGAYEVLRAGGTGTAEGVQKWMALDAALIALNASPGGSADMLAATLFLDALLTR